MPPTHWPRAIILMDMDAFFAAVEQREYPELRGRAVAITNGQQGSTIITCSYEARHYGIHTGMKLREAQALCPELIRLPARPELYAQVSREIMSALEDISPDIEIYSIDEAFIDVTRCQLLHGHPERMAQMVKERVFQISGLTCSVGVSGDKTTAKFAAKMNKPNGLMVIPPWEAQERLRGVPVTALSGIARGVGEFLAQYNIQTCDQIATLPISVLAQRFGNLGRRIWLMSQGQDPERMHLRETAPKSMGHGKVLPPNTRSREILLSYLLHMAEKLGRRLRLQDLEAQHFLVGLKGHQGWLGEKPRLDVATNDSRAIYRLAYGVLNRCWQGEGIKQVQITALDPRPRGTQLDLFSAQDRQRDNANQATDLINQRYGSLTLAPARLLKHTPLSHNVISPAWRMQGYRNSI